MQWRSRELATRPRDCDAFSAGFRLWEAWAQLNCGSLDGRLMYKMKGRAVIDVISSSSFTSLAAVSWFWVFAATTAHLVGGVAQW